MEPLGRGRGIQGSPHVQTSGKRPILEVCTMNGPNPQRRFADTPHVMARMEDNPMIHAGASDAAMGRSAKGGATATMAP